MNKTTWFKVGDRFYNVDTYCVLKRPEGIIVYASYDFEHMGPDASMSELETENEKAIERPGYELKMLVKDDEYKFMVGLVKPDPEIGEYVAKWVSLEEFNDFGVTKEQKKLIKKIILERFPKEIEKMKISINVPRGLYNSYKKALQHNHTNTTNDILKHMREVVEEFEKEE